MRQDCVQKDSNFDDNKQEKKTYNPKDIEESLYEICESRGYFEVDYSKQKSFCIMMPPPNVTGVLHIGHALTFSLQDIIVRFKRMDGYATLYQPGMDHAGIATQNVVEKQLLAQGIKKQDIGREEFLKKVWEWKEESGGKILHQMRKLGITPAWSRLRFTMDNGLQNAVKRAFVEWYNRGLIIQDSYMINWCTHDGALSDIEVEYKENEGFLYYLRYPVVDCKDTQCVIVATTRPETFFGDTAVMVNPNDSRYKHLVGKEVQLPLVGRKIKIIADEAVDIEFGTGCVKVTPAHDMNDYEVGKRHNLEFLTIFDKNGILNELAGEFEGLERLSARESIVQKLQQEGFIEKIEPYTNQVGKCYRCGNVIEPYISKQWFVKKEVAFGAITRVNQKQTQFFPSQWLNNFNAWMKELRPWCISRQLWWGHRIPVWYCECGEKVASEIDNPKCPKCGVLIQTQDEDVLDTWFSSGLWAFSTLGWGNTSTHLSKIQSKSSELDLYQPQDLERFYPNSLLITGFDILFFWVARMLFSGESLLDKIPFKDIYLHALVRDEKGEKMSKSRGNVIDPLEMIQIYGADSLRFSLAALCVQGRDIRLSVAQLELSKNFANKMFNATQFLLLYARQLSPQSPYFKDLSVYTTPLGKYMKSRLNFATKSLRTCLESYRFNEATNVLYHFLWNEFCDWGIELAKAQKESIFEIGSVFKDALKLLHPFMPFLSDDLWHSLNGSSVKTSDSIMIAPFPCDEAQDKEIEQSFEVIKDCVVSLRRIRANLELGNAQIHKAYLKISHNIDLDLLQVFVCKLAKIENLEIIQESKKGCVSDVGEFVESFIDLEGIDLGAIKARLLAQEVKLQKEIAKLDSMLSNPNFLKNAPQNVLTQNKEALKNADEKLSKVQAQLSTLG